MVTMQIVKPAPKNVRITSAFGPRVAPKPGASTFHQGLDYGGTFKVTAARAGKVVKIGKNLDKTSGYGHYVVLRHTEVTKKGIKYWETLYAHAATATHLKLGAKVKVGEYLFISGDSGSATGPHLHFELHKRIGWGKKAYYVAVDPLLYIYP